MFIDHGMRFACDHNIWESYQEIIQDAWYYDDFKSRKDYLKRLNGYAIISQPLKQLRHGFCTEYLIFVICHR